MIGTIILGVLGLCSYIYFVIYAMIIGLNNTFTYFWLLLGGLLLGAGSLKYLVYIGKISISNRIYIPVTVVAVACLLILLVTEIIIVANVNQKPKADADYVIVLGARVNGTRVTANLSYRLDAAKEYLDENPDTKVIVSGGRGKGEDITEAQAMYDYLIKKNVSAERIIKEDKSVNTEENLRFSSEIIGDKSASVVIVTNDFHVYRAKSIAKKQGYTAVWGIGSKTKPITVLNSYVREAFAVIKYKLCGQI